MSNFYCINEQFISKLLKTLKELKERRSLSSFKLLSDVIKGSLKKVFNTFNVSLIHL